MDVKLWTGNGTSQTISGLGFSPDLVWIKNRNLGSDHEIYDRTRGAENVIKPSNTDAEGADANALLSFTSTGWTLGNSGAVNRNNDPIVAWTWDAGSSAVSNSNGSITSLVRRNSTAGFSIVTYSGVGYSNVDDNFTVGHGLGVKPAMVIVKKRNNTGFWAVWHTAFGDPAASGTNNKYIILSSSGAQGSLGAGYLFKDASTSDVFGIGVGSEVNGSGSNFVAYCFAPVEGYSAVTSFVGNGLTAGPFVHLGFRPKFILYKSSTSGDWWNFLDTERSTYNPLGPYLQSNAASEGTASLVEIFSNGFRPIFNLGNQWNGSGQTYIVYAVAEHPFKYARAR